MSSEIEYSIVSTGFSSGIGSFAKEYMEAHYPEWHHLMLCRDPSKQTSKPNLTVIKCELSSIESVQDACKEIKNLLKLKKVPPVKYILANAGAATSPKRASANGFEMNFHVNVVSNYILIKELLPILEKNPRVLITGSDIHHGKAKGKPEPYWDDENLNSIFLPRLDNKYGDPESFMGAVRAYSTSKLAALYLAHQFARKNPDVKFLVYHPGVIPSSGLTRELSFLMRMLASTLGKLLQLTGATMSSKNSGDKLAKYMFEDDLFEKTNNVLYSEVGKIMDSSPNSYDQAREEQLWNYLEES